MADIAQSLKSWSSTLGSNLPTSSTTIGTGLAPNLQQIQSTLRYELATRSASITALATTDIGVQDEGTVLILNATGTVAITSFGIVSVGIKKLVTFNVTGGVLSITYNASSMILPSAANINVLTGDSLLAESLGAGNWKVHAYYKISGLPTSTTGIALSGANTDITSLASPAIAGATATTQLRTDSTTKVATTAMVQSVGLNSNGIGSYTGTATLTTADIGRHATYNSASAGTLTLPSVSGLAVGSMISVSNIIGVGVCTIARAGTSLLSAFAQVGVTSININPGDSLQLLTDGTNWLQVTGSNGLGVGQTRVNVTASRAVNTNYTNTSGKPKTVNITMNHVTGAIATLVINGINVSQTSGNSATSIYINHSGIVQTGETYQITQTAGTPALILWTELG